MSRKMEAPLFKTCVLLTKVLTKKKKKMEELKARFLPRKCPGPKKAYSSKRTDFMSRKMKAPLLKTCVLLTEVLTKKTGETKSSFSAP